MKIITPVEKKCYNRLRFWERTSIASMRNKGIATLLVGTIPFLLSAKNPVKPEREAVPKLSSAAVSFIENKGQVKDQNGDPRPDVLFSGYTTGMIYHLRNNGISYQLSHAEKAKLEIYRLDVNWLGINPEIKIATEGALPGVDHFYNCAQPVFHVRTYSGVVYKNLYNNIDLHYYEKSGDLKYDYIVAPHADYRQIQLEIRGAEKILLQKDGSLLFKTPFGEIMEGAPLVYQAGKKLNAFWKVKNNVLSFEIENYDVSKPLLIDPATRVWGTYYGTGAAQFLGTNGNGCSTDASGNIYFVGLTDASAGTGIATSGSHQATLSGGFGDAFLVKFNSAGVRQWGTYYGGSGVGASTHFNICKIDASGNIYAGGLSSASNGISTPGSHQPAVSTNGDAMLVKFNSAGVRQWGTYYGDSGTDEINDIGLDAAGNVYVVGRTSSSSAISTPGSHQATYGGTTDAFLAKFNSAGVRQWSTYYGGAAGDWGYTMGMDASANIYIAGSSSSTTGISTAGAHQTAMGGGTDDAFLAKFNNNGVLQWGTYYGGSASGLELINGCDVDASGNVFVAGYTGSSSGIATSGAYQTVFAGGPSGVAFDAFLVKFNGAGVCQWGTYLGGTGEDRSADCVCDPFGNVIIVGETNSASGIAVAGNHQTVLGGNKDAFMAKFTGAGANLWATYYGGSARDVGSGCAVDNAGTKIYLSGSTETAGGTAIATAGSHQTSKAATDDAFLAQFSDCIGPNAPVNTTSAANLTLCVNTSATISATASGPVDWFATAVSTATLGTGGTFITPPLSSGTYTYYAATTNSCSQSARTAITLTVSPQLSINSGMICAGESFTIIPGGAASYTFSGGSAVVSPNITSSYTISGKDSAGCTGTIVSTVSVNPLPVITVNSGTICQGNSFTLQPGGASTYTYSGGTAVISPTTTSNYSVTGTDANGCIGASPAISTVVVSASPTLTASSSKTLTCKGEPTNLSVSGAVNYTWVNTGATGTLITVSPTISTNYTVTGTDANSCAGKTVLHYDVKSCTGLSEESGAFIGISIRPNPTHGSFRISTSSVLQNGSIEIYNAIGQLVLSEKHDPDGNKIDLSHEASGIYYIRVLENNQVLGSTKIIKE